MLLPIDRRRLTTALAMVCVVAAAPVVAQAQTQPQEQRRPQQPQSQPQKPKPAPRPPAKAATPQPPAKTEAMAPSQVGIPTLAKHAFMVDPITSTVLLYKDADTPMSPSSMAKLMTIYIVFEELAAGRIKLDTKFRVSERARAMGGSRMFIEIGSEVSVEDLIRGMIVLSGNDACVTIAEGLSGNEDAFAERMTRRGRELGLSKSVFKNASGWPAEGQYSTARDLAVLSWRTIEDFPKLYRYYAETNWTYNNIKQENRNRLLRTTAGVDGLKTGHTEDGGYGQATSAVRDGRRLVLVVNGLGSMADRAQEAARLMDWGYREFSNVTIFRPGAVVADAPVWLGTQDKVPLVIPHAVQVTLPANQSAPPSAVARFEGPVAAPITKGARIGSVAITLPDGRSVEYPLEAGADVGRQGVIGRMTTLIRHYVFGWLS